MARKPPPEHTRFKPGQSGNPGGKPRGLLTADKVSGIIGQFFDKTLEELQAIMDNPKATMGEKMVASAMLKSAETGDFNRVEPILQRGIGKVKEQIESTVRTISDEKLDAIPTEKLLLLVANDK